LRFLWQTVSQGGMYFEIHNKFISKFFLQGGATTVAVKSKAIYAECQLMTNEMADVTVKL